MLVGSRVTDTIRTEVISLELFENDPSVLMLGMTCAIVGSATYLTIATRFTMPVSTTHSIMGGVIGVSIAAAGTEGVNWSFKGVSSVFPAWGIAHGITGCFGAIIFMITEHGVMRRSNPVRKAFIMVPIYCKSSNCTPSSMTVLTCAKSSLHPFFSPSSSSGKAARPRSPSATHNPLESLSVSVAPWPPSSQPFSSPSSKGASSKRTGSSRAGKSSEVLSYSAAQNPHSSLKAFPASVTSMPVISPPKCSRPSALPSLTSHPTTSRRAPPHPSLRKVTAQTRTSLPSIRTCPAILQYPAHPALRAQEATLSQPLVHPRRRLLLAQIRLPPRQ
jgi:phosphate/sulfate permease